MSINAQSTVPTYTILAAIVLAVYGGRGSWAAELAFWVVLLAAVVFLIGVYLPRVEAAIGGAAFLGILLAGGSRFALGRSGLGPGAAALSPALLAAPAAASVLVRLVFQRIAGAQEASAGAAASRAATLDELGPFFGDKRPSVFSAATRRFSELAGPSPRRQDVHYVVDLARTHNASWRFTSRATDVVVQAFIVGKETSTPVLLELFEQVGEWSPSADEAIQNVLLSRNDLDIASLVAAAGARLENQAPYNCGIDRVVALVRTWDETRARELARSAFLGGALSAAAALQFGEEWAAGVASEAVARETDDGNHDTTLELIGQLRRDGVRLLAKAIATWDANRINLPFALEHSIFFKNAPLLDIPVSTISADDRAALVRALDARLAEPLDRDFYREIYTKLRAWIAADR